MDSNRLHTRSWGDIVRHYDDLLARGMDVGPMLDLCRFLADSAYTSGLFPASTLSMQAGAITELHLGRSPDFARGDGELVVRLFPARALFSFTYFQRADDVTPWSRECAEGEGPAVLEHLLRRRLRWFTAA
jgi:hypothetical protein